MEGNRAVTTSLIIIIVAPEQPKERSQKVLLNACDNIKKVTNIFSRNFLYKKKFKTNHTIFVFILYKEKRNSY